MRRIFLSASFPKRDRVNEAGPSSSQDIGLATAATVEAALLEGFHLVFGGHPSISPVVLNLARLIPDDAGVTIYQSKEFADQITHEVDRLQKFDGVTVINTPRGNDRSDSLLLMRNQMLSGPYDGAFFVGGMRGIEDEFDAMGGSATCRRFLYTAPGGRAARIAERLLGDELSEQEVSQPCGPGTTALHGRGYARLALRALKSLLDTGDA